MNKKDEKRLLSRSNVKGNVRYITIADHDLEHHEFILQIIKSSYDWYAYILHDSDLNEDGLPVSPHYHYIAYERGGTSLKAHCQRFESVLAPNFINKVFNHRAMVRYLIHKDNPEKAQYAPKLIMTNNPDIVSKFLDDRTFDVMEQFRDFTLVNSGQITFDEYFEKYRSDFADMPFYQRVNLFHKLAQKRGVEPPATSASFKVN